MLEVGAVGGARRPDDDRRAADPRWSRREERVEQQLRVVGDRPHRVAREQLRHQPAHRDPVLEHVGDPGGDTDVVLEHSPDAVSVADQIAAGDVAPDAARRPQAVSGAGEAGPGRDQPPGHDAVADDLTLAVDVGDEAVQRLDALLHAVRDEVPLGGRDDPRDQIERERAIPGLPVGPGRVEGDPALHEDRVAALGRGLQALAPQPVQRLDHLPRLRVRVPGVGEALVEPTGGRLVGNRRRRVRPLGYRFHALWHIRVCSAGSIEAPIPVRASCQTGHLTVRAPAPASRPGPDRIAGVRRAVGSALIAARRRTRASQQRPRAGGPPRP